MAPHRIVDCLHPATDGRTHLDADHHAVLARGIALLPPMEWRILSMLCRRPGHLLRRLSLVNELYGLDPNGGPLCAQRSIDVRICRLRRRLHEIGSDWRISTICCEGWVLVVP